MYSYDIQICKENITNLMWTMYVLLFNLIDSRRCLRKIPCRKIHAYRQGQEWFVFSYAV